MSTRSLPRSWWKITALFLFATAVLYGAFLRLYQLNTPSWWMDEAYSITSAVATLEQGYPLLDSGRTNTQHILESYILAGTIRMFGLHNWSTRVPSVIFGLLSIGVLYIFSRRFFGKKIALLATLFMLFSYWEIAWSRQARFYTLFQCLFWASLYFSWKFIFEKRRLKDFLFACLFGILAFFTHMPGMLLLPIVLTTAGMYAFTIRRSIDRSQKSRIFTAFLCVAVAGGLLLTPLAPRILAALSNPIFYLPKYLLFIRDNLPLTFVLAFATALIYPNNKYLLSLQNNDPTLPKILFREKIWSLYLVFLIPLIAFSFFIPLLHYRYLFVTWPALYLLTAITIVSIFSYVKRQQMAAAAIVAVLIGAGYNYLLNEFQLTPRVFYALESDKPERAGYASYTPQPNWEAAYQYVSQKKQEDDILISAQPVLTQLYTKEPGYWLAYSLSNKSEEKKEIHSYVNAPAIWTLGDLQRITSSGNGFIIVDGLSLDGRIPVDIQGYMKKQPQVFFEETNEWSKVWVYSF